MFKVRTGAFTGQQELCNGDSTFRANEDSILGGLENDRGDIISESEDGGWYQSEKEGNFLFKHDGQEDELSDISENS